MPLPSVTSDLVFWFDARDITGVSDGSTVSTWDDSTGNAHTATVTTGSATYHTGQYNGDPALTLANCNLNIANMSGVSATNAHTCFAIFRTSITTSGYSGFIIGQQSLGHFQFGVLFNGSHLLSIYEDFFGPAYGTATADTNWHQAVAQEAGGAFGGSGYVNLVIDGVTDPYTSVPSLATAMNPPDALGSSPSGGNYFAGQVQVIGYWNRVLNSTEIAALFGGTSGGTTVRQPMIFVVT